jgi:hypothetical protein
MLYPLGDDTNEPPVTVVFLILISFVNHISLGQQYKRKNHLAWNFVNLSDLLRFSARKLLLQNGRFYVIFILQFELSVFVDLPTFECWKQRRELHRTTKFQFSTLLFLLFIYQRWNSHSTSINITVLFFYILSIWPNTLFNQIVKLMIIIILIVLCLCISPFLNVCFCYFVLGYCRMFLYLDICMPDNKYRLIFHLYACPSE